ncbi:MAG: sodium-dependent transporter [Victivallaceae bacterium]|nr:sodium-dependent transporter [Victivallaceae bacterium]
MNKRETLSSRIGFLLMTSGCAIGLGNIWRFPYIAGKYGGGIFLLRYAVCLVVLGFPALVMELAIGRAGRKTLPGALRDLQGRKGRFRWDIPGYFFFFGNLLLLMFYTVVSGWLIDYAFSYATGQMHGDPRALFDALLASFPRQTLGMLIALFLTVAMCFGGVRSSLEKSIKWMMGGLFALMLILCAKALTLPGVGKGLMFFFVPDASRVGNDFFDALVAAMTQAFFTLSIGFGSVALCGSYQRRDRALAPESVWIIVLDTLVAVTAGVIIFCCCASFGVPAAGGPSLIFIALPNVFENLPGGVLWGTVFFLFLAVAAISTLVAVFEALVAFGMDEWGIGRKCCCLLWGGVLAVLSMPCILGFNLWKGFSPLGQGSNILDLEDFVVSDNILPLGALYLTLFVAWKWKKEAFFGEVNTGNGWKFSPRFFFYYRWILPFFIFAVWVIGIVRRFF